MSAEEITPPPNVLLSGVVGSTEKFPPGARAEAAQRYAQGEHTGQLAEVYGVCTDTIRRALREAGITPDRRRSGHASWVARTQAAPDEGDLVTGFRWCIDCRKRKPMSEYYWRNNASKKSRQRRCKPCHGKNVRANSDRKAVRRKMAYGLTAAGFDQLWREQAGRCAICRDELDREADRSVNVDHCHFDEQVRGLLCTRCNTGLGHFRDDPELLWAAAAYLMKEHWHPSLESLLGKAAT